MDGHFGMCERLWQLFRNVLRLFRAARQRISRAAGGAKSEIRRCAGWKTAVGRRMNVAGHNMIKHRRTMLAQAFVRPS